MKHYFIIFILLVGYTAQSQVSNFNKAKLTKKNGDVQEVFYKEKQYIVDNKGSLNIYSTPNNSNKLIITSNDFSKIESDDKRIMIISALVRDLDKNNFVVLRKLVDGNNSLYKHINSLGESTFINKFNSNYSKLNEDVENKDIIYYKKWLFKNLNPRNENISSYVSLKYNQNDLISCYISNQDNSIELTQEEKVKTFNLSVYSGVLFNKVSGDFFDAKKVSSTNIKIGVQASIALDQVKNNHSLFGGLTYYTAISGTGAFIANPKSQIHRRKISTELELNLWSFQLGYQYNFHLNKMSISPFLAFESMYYLSNNSIKGVSQEDQSQLFFIDTFSRNPISYNIGLKMSLQQKMFIMLEYNAITDIIVLNEVPFREINSNISRLSVSLGYKIF